MFRVYKVKPKVAEKIKAVQVTPEKAAEIANALSGRVTFEGDAQTGIMFPTLDGLLRVPMNNWIVRHENAKFEVVENDKFVENWEVARNTSGN